MSAVRPITRDDIAAAPPLLEATPFLPYRRHSARTGRDALVGLALERIGDSIGRGFVVPGDGGPAAMAVWEPLPFDTELLGTPAARVGMLVGAEPDLGLLISALVDDCRANEIGHLTARVDAADLAATHALERHGFVTVDHIVDFALVLDGPGDQPPVGTRAASPEDADVIAEIARTSFVYDRFHMDPVVSRERADRIYETWARNSVRGTVADAVFVAETDGEVGAFVACVLDDAGFRHLGFELGRITLVATREKMRDAGLAGAVTKRALSWFGGQGAAVVEVGTQLSNARAARVYQRCGFQIVGAQTTLRAVPADG